MAEPRWISPAAFPVLSRDAVHVWRGMLDLPAPSVARSAGLLSPEEQARASRFHFARDRRRFILAHGMLRSVVGAYLATAPSALRFERHPRGKPALIAAAGARRLCFNLSHSGELALLAVADDRDVGVDVERIRPLGDAGGISERHFAASERDRLRAAPADRTAEVFFTYWTRKEAVLKATGDGLLSPLEELDVSGVPPGCPGPLVVSDRAGLSHRLVVIDLRPAAGYAGALAAEGEGWQLACWRWDDERKEGLGPPRGPHG